jgi:hypothetical protein
MEVILSDGEPALHPDFPEVLDLAQDLFPQVMCKATAPGSPVKRGSPRWPEVSSSV